MHNTLVLKNCNGIVPSNIGDIYEPSLSGYNARSKMALNILLRKKKAHTRQQTSFFLFAKRWIQNIIQIEFKTYHLKKIILFI